MGAVPEPSLYEVSSLQAQDVREETASFSGGEDLTEKVASSFCEGNRQESKSWRKFAKKRLKRTRVNEEEGPTWVEFKIEKLQSSRGALERRSTGVRIMEEGLTKNVKAEDGYISSVLPDKNLKISGPSHKGEHLFQDVIIIEDDDDDNDDNADGVSELNLEDLTSDSEGDHDDALTSESDASSSENPRSISSQSIGQRLDHNVHPISSSDPTNYFNKKDESQIFETGNLFTSLRSMKRIHRQKSSGKEPAGHYTDVSESATSSDGNSSECEIMEGSCGKIRQQWEAAALKKRVAQGVKFRRYVVEEEASASGSNLEPNSLFREFEREGKERPDGNLQDHYVDHCSTDPPDLASTSGIIYTSGQEDVTSPITMNKSEIPNSGVETSDGVSLGQSTNTVEVKPLREEMECDQNSFGMKMKEVMEFVHPKSRQGAKKSLKSTSGEAKKDSAVMEKMNVWEGDREKLKKTAEFKHAEQEEWARRHLELQRQAEEARQLWKRKRSEVARKLEMERRQKQRLEEMRENQKKDEETMHLKDQLRGQVRAELEQVASQCKDMASLLRHLGIHVEGGAFPFSQQVNAAYKQALLRFHPDRASKRGLRQQVEAEETFKLISRLKDTLLPVAPMSLKRTSWQ
jgi:hypothetical protein